MAEGVAVRPQPAGLARPDAVLLRSSDTCGWGTRPHLPTTHDPNHDNVQDTPPRMNAPLATPALKASRPRIAIVGAGPGGLASAMLLAAQGAQVTIFEKDKVVGGRTRTLSRPTASASTSGRPSSSIPRVLAEIFARRRPRPARTSADGPRSTRSTTWSSGRRRALDATADLARMEAEIAKLSPRRRERLPPLPRRQPRQAGRGSGPCWRAPFLGLPTVLAPGAAEERCRCCGRWQSLDAELAPLFRRPAGAAGLLVPVEVPGHVAVQLPEPVLDPVVPGIRARRLAPRSAAAARLGGDGAGRASELGVEIALERAGRGDRLRGPQGRRRPTRERASTTRPMRWSINADFAAGHDRSWCPTACAAAGPTRRSAEETLSPARPS